MTSRSPRPRGHRASALEHLFEAVHAGVFIGTLTPSDRDDAGPPLAVNPHLRQMFGYPADAPESSVTPFAPARFADPAAREAFLARLTVDGAVTDYLLRMLHVDGKAVWVEVTARADPTAGGSAIRVEALLRDVSERRKLDARSRDTNQQLLEAEQAAALGQTISSVAHELNNPLTTILGWAERISAQPLNDVSRRGIEIILGETRRAARIVRNMLTFARRRQSTRAMVDVNAIVRETLDLRSHEQHVMNVAATTALAPGLPPVFADAHQIQQVLLNLITNAEQAMLSANGRGSMTIRTWQDRERGAVLLEVNDDGPGIPLDVRSRIFDPFFTTKEIGKGTGLGLTVADAIARDHGGQLRVESQPGRGASFVVELPVSWTETPRQAAASEPPPRDS